MITKGLTITEALTKARDEGGYAGLNGLWHAYEVNASNEITIMWKDSENIWRPLMKNHSGDPVFSWSIIRRIDWLHVTTLSEVV
jgi:hypothetical protein